MRTLRIIGIVIVWLAAVVPFALYLSFAFVWVLITEGGGGGPKGGLPVEKKSLTSVRRALFISSHVFPL